MLQSLLNTLASVLKPAKSQQDYNVEQDHIDRADILKHFSAGGTVESLNPYLRKRCAYICMLGAGVPVPVKSERYRTPQRNETNQSWSAFS